MKNRVIIITGVSGSGKTTVGLALAERLQASFFDGDAFHPESNIAKMSSGIPLTDEDRYPWLKSINDFIRQKVLSETVVITCSALKEAYRKILSANIDSALVIWVHLQGNYDLIHERMLKRSDHFMTATMLRSQLDVYEKPEYGITVTIDQDLDQLVDCILSEMKLSIYE
jgi:carbohydrate kinase (thermoresistant glucokinase family)